MAEPKKPVKKTAPRVRRTQAQIAADKLAEAKRIEELAAERAAKIPAPKVEPWSRTVHFLVDGYTACGNVWYYGQELTIREGTAEFELAFDSLGNFIFDKSIEEQLAQWGEVRYAPGPWKGKPYELGVQELDIPLDNQNKTRTIVPDDKELAALKEANKNRLMA